MSEIWLTCGLSICAGLFFTVLVLIGYRFRLLRFRNHAIRLRNHAQDQRRQLQELSSAVSARRFELDWLNCIATHPGRIAPILELLRQSSENPQQYFATGCTPEGTPVATVPAELRELFHLNDSGFRKLDRTSIASLATSKRDFTILGSPEFGQLLAIPCLAAGEFQGWLLISHPPEITGTREEDLSLLLSLCQSISIPDPAQDPIADQDFLSRQEEVRLVRDMLQLRTLSDEEFTSPVEMLEEFLKHLALLAGVERASCYHRTGFSESRIECLGRGGRSGDADADDACREIEQLLLSGRKVLEMTWVRLRELNCHFSHPFELALLVPIHDPRISGGVLVMLCRAPNPRRAIIEELAHWSAEYLPTSFERAVTRQAIVERAKIDGLTRVANRQSFDEELRKRVAEERACDLLLIDIDHFKSINDHFGHLAGDEILRAAAQVILHQVQLEESSHDAMVARYGGEEFAVILSQNESGQAVNLAERIRNQIDQTLFSADGQQLSISVSVGVAQAPTRPASASELVRRADRALYRAKHSGRNRVAVDVTIDRPSVVRLDS